MCVCVCVYVCVRARMYRRTRTCVLTVTYREGGEFDAERDRHMFNRGKLGGGSQKHPCHA